jgi:hypothetical protein
VNRPRTSYIVLIFAVLAFGILGLVAATASAQASPAPRTEYLPCSTDEGPDGDRNCVWDARHEGNGMGASYFVGEGGKVYPLPHHLAHFLIYGK